MGSTACAGNKNSEAKDHPHIHGEHLIDMVDQATDTGSPPYTWGAPTRLSMSTHFMRITPIYMGSTYIDVVRPEILRDHPHIHGEHAPCIEDPFNLIGSPPYTWGAPTSHNRNLRLGGITPIYMGSTYTKDGELVRI